MKTWTEYKTERFVATASAVAAGLRAMADRVECEGKPRPCSIGYTPGTEFQVAAQNIVHAVIWGVANLNLDGLIMFAAEADMAPRLEAEEAAKS